MKKTQDLFILPSRGKSIELWVDFQINSIMWEKSQLLQVRLSDKEDMKSSHVVIAYLKYCKDNGNICEAIIKTHSNLVFENIYSYANEWDKTIITAALKAWITSSHLFLHNNYRVWMLLLKEALHIAFKNICVVSLSTNTTI